MGRATPTPPLPPCTKEMRSTVETLGYRVGHTQEAKTAVATEARMPWAPVTSVPWTHAAHSAGALGGPGKCTTGKAKTTASDYGVLNAYARRLHLLETTHSAH